LKFDSKLLNFKFSLLKTSHETLFFTSDNAHVMLDITELTNLLVKLSFGLGKLFSLLIEF